MPSAKDVFHAAKAFADAQTPSPETIATLAKSASSGLASDFFDILKRCIQDFESSLDENHEVGMRLASFGQSVTMVTIRIEWVNPSTLVFHGYVNDRPATLVQHVNQLNFLLCSVKKADPEKPPRRIGFGRDEA